jgi:hypothetical protein
MSITEKEADTYSIFSEQLISELPRPTKDDIWWPGEHEEQMANDSLLAATLVYQLWFLSQGSFHHSTGAVSSFFITVREL